MKNKKDKNQGFFQSNSFIKNRKGWIKVLEVFVSIILVMGVIVLLVSRTYLSRNISDEVFSMEDSILNIIQYNESLRGIILDASLPTNWNDFNSTGLGGVRDEILINKFPSFECEARVCSLSDTCGVDILLEKDVYAESAIFSADANTYSPRQLKIFCWEK